MTEDEINSFKKESKAAHRLLQELRKLNAEFSSPSWIAALWYVIYEEYFKNNTSIEKIEDDLAIFLNLIDEST